MFYWWVFISFKFLSQLRVVNVQSSSVVWVESRIQSCQKDSISECHGKQSFINYLTLAVFTSTIITALCASLKHSRPLKSKQINQIGKCVMMVVKLPFSIIFICQWIDSRFQYPLIYDIRSRPRKISSPTGSKDLQVIPVLKRFNIFFQIIFLSWKLS